MRHSNKERDNVAESRPGSNTGIVYVYTLYLFICMHFICKIFSKASGVYVGVCPVHNHRVYRFSQACNYSMKKSI